MKKLQYSESQIVKILKEVESGRLVKVLRRWGMNGIASGSTGCIVYST